jgi:Zn-dependent protease
MSESTHNDWQPSPFEDIGVGLRRTPMAAEEPRPLPEPLTAPEPITAAEAPGDEVGPVREEHRLRSLGRALVAPFVALFALVLKFKTALLVVFKFKLFTVAGSMLVSLAAYTAIWGWAFALGFVLLLFVHEMGHVLEARRQGLPASLPVFVPLMGAAIILKKMPRNAWHEAQVALAGPLVGSLASGVVWWAGYATDTDLLRALGYTGFFLNLFNLLPVVPLDGGRAVVAIHPAMWLLGFGMLVGLLFVMPNPILILIAVLAGYELLQRWRVRNEAHDDRYYEVSPRKRVLVAIVYFGLAAALALAMSQTHLKRTF